MAEDPELRRRLQELAYDLLPDDEAAALRRQIDADPELARAYAEVERTARLFSSPANPESPKNEPASSEPSNEVARPKRPLRTNGPTAAGRARWADWTVAVSAGVLLVISLSGWVYHRAQLADVSADHLRLQVTGPAHLHPGVASQYSVSTTSATGKPVSSQVEFSLYSPDGDQLMGHKEKTDENGRLTLTVPADLPATDHARLELTASDDGRQQRADTRLPVEPVRCVTQVLLDKPRYRPGETIHYRWRTLRRFALAAGQDLQVQIEILDPGKSPVPASQAEVLTSRGMGGGEFPIPEGLAGGKYTLVARSPQGWFPDQQRTFYIHEDRPPRLAKQLRFDRPGYAPGDKVVADVSVLRAEGVPAAGAKLRVVATVDGEVVHDETTEASPLGTLKIELTLPDEIEQGDAQLVVVADDGGLREALAKRIPLGLEKLVVSFYPEGGPLVAMTENQVYFAARTPLGEPADVRGTVVDSRGNRIVRVETSHRGLGTFSILPFPNEEYRLELEGPAAAEAAAKLPEVSSDHKVVLNAGVGVFSPGAPLEFNVRAGEAGLPLVAAASCRGVPVGQQVFLSQKGANPVAIPLEDEVAGVIRLTIYDYRSSPPEPVAERLVFRRPSRRLRLEFGEPSVQGTPGEAVTLPLRVTDENGDPLLATLGATWVELARSESAGRNVPNTLTHFLLAADVQDPQDLPDLDFYLSDAPDAAVALDLLLGTQGWRRFLEQRLRQLDADGRRDASLFRMASLDGQSNPPAMFDNLSELQRRYAASLAAYRAHHTKTSQTLTTLSFFGGIGLVIWVAMLGMLNVASGLRLWVPAAGTAAVCLIIGAILMDPGRLKSPPEGPVPFAPFDPAEAPPPVAIHESEATDTEKTDPEKRSPALKQTTTGSQPSLPGVEVADSPGRAQVRLQLPDVVTSFRVLVDGHAEGGRLGSGQVDVAGRLPFWLDPRLPLEAGPGDRIDVPLALVNDTDEKLSATLVLEHGQQVRLDGPTERKLQLEPKQRTRQFFSLQATEGSGDCPLTFRADAGQWARDVTARLRIALPDDPAGVASGPQAGVDACPLRLSTQLSAEGVPWGQTVTLSAQLANSTGEEQSAVVAVLGLPAGLEVRLDQLDQIQRAGTLDYYQTRPRQVICHWQKLGPKKKVALRLDLIAAIPGSYTGPSSRAYLDHAPQQQCRTDPLTVEITRQ